MFFDRGKIATTGQIEVGTFLDDVYTLEVMDKKNVISESSGQKRPVTRVTGIFQRCDKINANGRVYPSEILGGAIDAIREDIASKKVLGEFDHPADAKIHLDRVSHVITKLWMEGKIVYGEMEILDQMPCGAMLKALFDSGINVGISSRGVGDMETTMLEGEEVYKVLPGYRFVTFDAVVEPSVPDSYLAVMESKIRLAKIEHKKNNEKQLLKEFRNFLESTF